MDYTEVSKSIAETMENIGEPLTDTQQIVLTGSVAVWLEKAYRLGQRGERQGGFCVGSTDYACQTKGERNDGS